MSEPITGPVLENKRHLFALMIIDSEFDDSGLSIYARGVYVHLSRRADKTHVAYPGVDSIVKTLLISKRTVLRALKELEDRGFIRVTRNYKKPSVYELNPKHCWKEIKGERNPLWPKTEVVRHRKPKSLEFGDTQSPNVAVTSSHCSDTESACGDYQSQSAVTASHSKVLSEKVSSEGDIPDRLRSDNFALSSEPEKPKARKQPKPLDDASLASYIVTLKPLFPWVDFPKEVASMRLWLRRNTRRKLTEKFVDNWISKVDRPLTDDVPIPVPKRKIPCDAPFNS